MSWHWPWTELVAPCAHKWVKVGDIAIYDPWVSDKQPCGNKVVLQCDKCGDMKSVRL